LSVSASGAAAIAAPAAAARSMHLSNSETDASGRAASWIATISDSTLVSSSAIRTESWRSSPPAITLIGSVAPDTRAIRRAMSSHPKGAATTASIAAATWPIVRRFIASRDSPPSSTNAFGTFAPKRTPLPAATTMIDAFTAFTRAQI